MLNIPTPYIIIFLFGLTILGLIRYQNKPEMVFGFLLLVMFSGDLVSTQQVIDSFANQGVLTLMLLMACSLCLEKTRVLRVVANYIIKESYKVTWVRLFTSTVLSSAFLNNTVVVSTMLASIRNNPRHPSSKLLIPLSYAAILGGTLTLVGTSTNLIVNSMVLDKGLPSIGFFEFTPIGLALVGSCGVVLYFMSRYLPNKQNAIPESSEYFFDTKVLPNSSLIGSSIEKNGLRNLESLFLVEILRGDRLISPVSPQELIEESDRLIFSGDIKKITLLNHFDRLRFFASKNGLPMKNLTEVVVRPESRLVGKTLKDTGFRALFDAAVVAIKRDGGSVSGKLGEVIIKPGDYLVMAVGDDFKNRHNLSKNFYIVSGVETDGWLKGKKEILAIGGFFLAIGLAATDVVPLFQSMFVFLGCMLFTGIISSNEILQRLPWQIWIVISSAMLLSNELTNSGALDFINDVINNNQRSYTPLIGLVIVYLFTWILTELITNNAAAALMFPIGISLAESFSIAPSAYLMAVAFGASASFISPYGYQTNLMVFNAGQYKLSDFAKVGIPLSMVYAVVAIASIALIYQIV